MNTRGSSKNWLIAIEAFSASAGDPDVKLNEFLNSSPERKQFAVDVMTEMRDGIEVLLLQDPEYEEFRKDIAPGDYLNGTANVILQRLSRRTILSPVSWLASGSPHQTTGEKRVPAAAAHSKFSLVQLAASGTFVDGKVGG